MASEIDEIVRTWDLPRSRVLSLPGADDVLGMRG
jgi:hypothetical protein